MAGGLLLIAFSDVTSVMTSAYEIFMGVWALAGMGWAVFVTAATTVMVDRPTSRRGRAVSLLLMSETLGLLLGSTGGGWLYGEVGVVSPFVVKAACTLMVVVAVEWPTTSSDTPPSRTLESPDWHLLGEVLRTPTVQFMSLTNVALFAIQTGVLVSLYPLWLAEPGGLRPETIGLLISLSALGQLLALWFGGTASDRWGRTHILIPVNSRLAGLWRAPGECH
jgi:predicted MFS family arabinose efflux permease